MSKLNLTVGLTRVWEGPWELALSQKMSQTWEQPELTDTFHIFLPQLDILFSMRKLHKRRIPNQFLLRQKYEEDCCFSYNCQKENKENLVSQNIFHKIFIKKTMKILKISSSDIFHNYLPLHCLKTDPSPETHCTGHEEKRIFFCLISTIFFFKFSWCWLLILLSFSDDNFNHIFQFTHSQ